MMGIIKKQRMTWLSRFVLALAFYSIMSFFVISNSVFAVVKNEKDIYALSIYTGLSECYQTYAEESVEPFGYGEEFNYKHFFSKDIRGIGSGSYSFDDVHAEAIYIPTYVGEDYNKFEKNQIDNERRKEDSNLSCQQVFEDGNLQLLVLNR